MGAAGDFHKNKRVQYRPQQISTYGYNGRQCKSSVVLYVNSEKLHKMHISKLSQDLCDFEHAITVE